MPFMLSLRTFRLASTSGHIVQFTSNEPTMVPDSAVAEALRHGCVPTDHAGVEVQEEPGVPTKVEFRGNLRRSLLHLYMQRLVKENDTKNFDSGSVPKIDVLNKALGIDIGTAERKAVWQELLSANANGEEIALHVDAPKVLDVIDAESKADLLILALEQGLTEEQVAGLSARDLRKTMLGRYAGLTAN